MDDDEKFLCMMRALSDPNRLTILRILKGRRLCSCQILKDMDISQPTLHITCPCSSTPAS